MHNYLKSILFASIALLVTNCSHAPSSSVLTEDKEKTVFEASPLKIQIQLDAASILKDADELRLILKKEKWLEPELSAIERVFKTQVILKEIISNQLLIIPANGQVKLDLNSYCLNPGLAPPSEFEVYEWRKENIGIPYYSKLIRLSSSDSNFTQEKIQGLIWNLVKFSGI